MRIERIAVVSLLVVTAGCRQDMHDQPKYQPLERSAFFVDGRASRPLLAGTIALAAVVVTTNRLVWRRLYRLAETRFKLES